MNPLLKCGLVGRILLLLHYYFCCPVGALESKELSLFSEWCLEGYGKPSAQDSGDCTQLEVIVPLEMRRARSEDRKVESLADQPARLTG
jgi:hypothetical protein